MTDEAGRRLAALSALGEVGAITSGEVGKAVWGDAVSARQAAARGDALLTALAAGGLAALLDDERPKAWLRTPAGTAELSRHGMAGADADVPAPKGP